MKFFKISFMKIENLLLHFEKNGKVLKIHFPPQNLIPSSDHFGYIPAAKPTKYIFLRTSTIT